MALLMPLLTYPRLASVGDSCGCSLTNTTFRPLTADLIEDMGFTAYQEAIWARMTESRAVGVVQKSLPEFLMSRVGPVKGKLEQRSVGTTTQFAPFKNRLRKRNMGLGALNVASGAATTGAGVGDVPASAWDVIVNVGPGQFATAFKDLARFFIPGMLVSIEHYNASTLVAYNTTYKIYAAADVDEDNARVTLVPPFTAAQWAAKSAGEKLPFKPTFGVVNILANNISDWESFCPNAPTTNNQELTVDWFQTSRRTVCRNQEYEAALAKIMGGEVNQYLAKFRELPTAERNRQETAYWDSVWHNAIWFNGRISGHQTADPTWTDIQALEEVTDPEDTECVYERKANALGIHTQLTENGRRLDLQGGQLDFDMLSQLLYTLRRNRRLDGRSHDTIDLMMDRHTKARLDSLLTKYLVQEYGLNYQKNVEQGRVLDSTNVVMFQYTAYDLPKQHLKVALFADDFFDDRISAFGTTGPLGDRGRMIMAIEWEDLLIGILETNSVRREYKNDITAQANSLYTCRMKLNTKTFELQSTTWDVEIGDFERHLIIENFSDECPTITVSGCEPASS